MTSHILEVDDKIAMDDIITQYEFHTHLPYASQTLAKNDEIRIPINQQDVFTLPSKSFLYVEGTATATKLNNNVAVKLELVNNFIAFLFEEIRYSIGGVDVDRTRNVGMTTTLKNLLSMRASDKNLWGNAGFTGEKMSVEDNGEFSCCVPLRMLLGFAEDYKKVVLNVRQELVLLRSSTDNNCVITAEQDARVKINLTKVNWRVPYVNVEDVQRLNLMKIIDSDRALSMPFRSWQIHEYPILPQARVHNWTVKTSSQLEKPRYVVFALQTARKNMQGVDNGKFDLCGLNNVKLFLNSQFYPYDNLLGNTCLMYEMFADFQNAYYGREDGSSIVSFKSFNTDTPIVFIDCSKQRDTLKTGSVDVRLEFDTNANIPANTSAYCLIIHDTVVEYSALSGLVRRIF